MKSCIAAVDLPILCVPAQQHGLNSSCLSTGEVWAVLESFQDVRVRVLDVGAVQSAAHVSQHQDIILSQTGVRYTLRK